MSLVIFAKCTSPPTRSLQYTACGITVIKVGVLGPTKFRRSRGGGVGGKREGSRQGEGRREGGREGECEREREGEGGREVGQVLERDRARVGGYPHLV